MQRHSPERKVHDILVRPLLGQGRRAIGDARHRAQQAELVGGALVVVQDHAAQERQGARAVVGQSECVGGPGHARAALQIGSASDLEEGQPAGACEDLQLAAGHRPYGAAWRTLPIPHRHE